MISIKYSFFIGSIIYFARSATVRAVPLLDTCLATLAAGLIAGATATGAIDGTGPGTAVAFDGAITATIPAFIVPSMAMGADITPLPAAHRAAQTLMSVAKRTVPPATSAAEGAIVSNLSRAAAAGAIPVARDHTGE